MITEQQGIMRFNTSRGWVHKFVRRSGVQLFFKMHGKGRSDFQMVTLNALLRSARQRRDTRYKTSTMKMSSGCCTLWELLNHISLRLSHETNFEETSKQKCKERMTTAFCVNSVAIQKLLIRYIGK